MPVDFLIERFEGRPTDLAVSSPAGSCSFGELAGLFHYWDRALEREGVARGSVVALVGDFSPSAIALFLALAARGTIVVPQRRSAKPSERARQEEIAQVEVRIEIDEGDSVRLHTAGRRAAHRLYEELSAQGHPGLVGFSSGTSGEPKAAVHDFVPWLETFRPRRSGRSTLAFLLFDHLGGLRTMLYALSSGANVVAVADRSPQTVCEAIERERVELLPATPTFFNLLLLSGAHRKHDLQSLRVISYGAEPMPQSTLDRLRAAFPGVKLQQTYGLIEIGPLRTKSREDGSLWLKVGGEGVQTRVVDGVLQVRSPASIVGYLNAAAPITRDGWFETGDAVAQEGEYLRFLGRRSEQINVGGEKVFPVEVESVIQSIDGVADATVFGEPNPLIGQIVCARVSAFEEVDDRELARRVKRVCRQRLERFKVPVKVDVVEGGILQGARLKKSRPQAGGQ